MRDSGNYKASRASRGLLGNRTVRFDDRSNVDHADPVGPVSAVKDERPREVIAKPATRLDILAKS